MRAIVVVVAAAVVVAEQVAVVAVGADVIIVAVVAVVEVEDFYYIYNNNCFPLKRGRRNFAEQPSYSLNSLESSLSHHKVMARQIEPLFFFHFPMPGTVDSDFSSNLNSWRGRCQDS